MARNVSPKSGSSPSASHYVADRGALLLERSLRTTKRREATAVEVQGASQGKLIWRRFRKHRVATISLVVLCLLYAVAIFAEFFAPYDASQRFDNQLFASPAAIYWLDERGIPTWPYVYETTAKLDLKTYSYRSERVDGGLPMPIRLLVRGTPYKLLGIFPTDVHLFGLEGGKPVFLLGADQLGRDLLSRIIFASRISLFVGLAGVAISFVLGVILGGLSGYLGGWTDNLIQRLVEFILSIPQIPLWMGLSAAIPREWSGVQTFFAITLILSLVGWTGLARVVRGKVIALREEDYVTAARISSAGTMSIILRHLLPGFVSYLIVYITLAIPGMILGETTLSFLGLGINPPDVSWGTLLQQAQDLTVVANYPWLLTPCLFVMLAVVLFNFIGDGLRDAADPYSK